MKDTQSATQRCINVLCLSVSLAALVFFIHFPGRAYGMGGGMSGYSMSGYGMSSYGMGSMGSAGSMMSGYGMSSTLGNYGAGYGYGSGYSMTTAIPNTAAMFNGLGTGYTGTAVIPYYGQNSAFGNTYGNAYGNTYGNIYSNTYGNAYSNTYGLPTTGLTGTLNYDMGNNYGMGMDSAVRRDQGNMMDWRSSGMGSMGMGTGYTTTPTTTNPVPITTDPSVTTGTTPATSVTTPAALPGGAVMPYANAINSQGVAGFLNGIGTPTSIFTPRSSAAATGYYAPAYGTVGTFTPYTPSYGLANQYGAAYGNPWIW